MVVHHRYYPGALERKGIGTRYLELPGKSSMLLRCSSDDGELIPSEEQVARPASSTLIIRDDVIGIFAVRRTGEIRIFS